MHGITDTKMAYTDSADQSKDGLGDEEIVPVVVDSNTSVDWSEDEELCIKRKLDFILLPILGIAFFALQLDRGNIANALTSTITTDLGITTNQINVGSSLLSLGIVLLEIPSNIILQRIGPRNWLSGQIVAWGLVALFQNFITNYAGYLFTRILLGLCEAGFIPGALYTLSTWYKRDESSLRISIFFLGNLFAAACTSLIGAGILSMGARYGVSGWRWLFIIEGAITIAIGIIFVLLLPPKVGDGRPLLSKIGGGWSYFNSRESYILVHRVLVDDPTKSSGHIRISGKQVLATVRKPRILMHVLITLTANTTVTAINSYGPSVIKSLGYEAVQANAMSSVGSFLAIVVVVVLGWLADKTGKKSPSVLFAAVWALIAFTCLRFSADWSNGRRYAAVVFSMATNSVVHILNVGWLSVNCQNPQERSIAMAMIIMAANSAGIAGSQIFRTQDAPAYLHAFTACLALAAVALVEIIVHASWYFISNKKLEKGEGGAPVLQGVTESKVNRQTEALVKKWYWTW